MHSTHSKLLPISCHAHSKQQLKIDNHRLQDWKRQKIPAGKCLEKFCFEDLIKETGKNKKQKNNPLTIKKHPLIFFGHRVQFHSRKETAHTWSGFRKANVQQRFSNRHSNSYTVSHCYWPQDRSFPEFVWSWVTETSLQTGVPGDREAPGGTQQARLGAPRAAPPASRSRRPGEGGSASRANRPRRVPLPGWCPRRAPGARCPGSCPPCRSARRPPSPPGGTRSRWRRARRWKACGTAGATSCPSSASRSRGAAAAPGGCPEPPRSPRR